MISFTETSNVGLRSSLLVLPPVVVAVEVVVDVVVDVVNSGGTLIVIFGLVIFAMTSTGIFSI